MWIIIKWISTFTIIVVLLKWYNLIKRFIIIIRRDMILGNVSANRSNVSPTFLPTYIHKMMNVYFIILLRFTMIYLLWVYGSYEVKQEFNPETTWDRYLHGEKWTCEFIRILSKLFGIPVKKGTMVKLLRMNSQKWQHYQ